MLKAFIFDMDGVIVDSEPFHIDIDIKTMKHLGHEVEENVFIKYVGMTNPEMWKSVREEFSLVQSVEEIIAYQLGLKITELEAIGMEPIEGIRELLLDLKARGIPAGIASSSPRVFIEAVLGKFGLEEFFAGIASGEEVEKGKPAPDVYLEAARQLRVEPEHCLVLEDSRFGVAAGKAAGMRCIGYLNPNSGLQDLTQADAVVKRISDIHLDDWM
ncbi:HAD family phosphatase [Paenibacillus sp. M1]|uniref:HAD family phosphatase n=1 Tax=Paenibacillus haidiansis TaxID=1574488 RepID=A0ABU7VPJ9_9BACL